jgi:DNA-directed RNA polymerase specialized sigma24 family protein
MTIDDLKKVRRQKLRVEALQERIERLRSRAEYNQRQLGECGRSDPTRDRLAEYAAELDELERELTGEMIALEKQLAAVDVELAKLPENQEKVLRLRYMEGMGWRKVAVKMNYCEQYCKSIHVKARSNIMFDNITYK